MGLCSEFLNQSGLKMALFLPIKRPYCGGMAWKRVLCQFVFLLSANQRGKGFHLFGSTSIAQQQLRSHQQYMLLPLREQNCCIWKHQLGAAVSILHSQVGIGLKMAVLSS